MLIIIFGVVAGVISWGILFNVVWIGLAAVRPGTFADDNTTSNLVNLTMLLLASFIVSIAAGWLTRTIAKNQKALITLALVNLFIGIGVQGGSWDGFPMWYHMLFLLGVVPFTLLGGRLVGK
jgi:hypothetical protein